jgi:hypothetical protein
MTKAQQETAVGEGLAVGCLALGIASVTSNKMDVEFAFRHAWRDWQWAYLFPVVHASISRNDLLRIVRASPRRRGAIVAEWDMGRVLTPILNFDDESLKGAGALLETSTGVPFQGWLSLARAFTDDLGEDKVQRAE